MGSIYTFQDKNGQMVELSFLKNYFSSQPKHVWVICEYEKNWLLTIHPKRGYEFPGGKIEEGETPERAAFREVYEETGASIETLDYIGQYRVETEQNNECIIKNIYFARIKELHQVKHFHETKGPILFSNLPKNIKEDENYSFIMKDRVLELALEKIMECLK